MTHRRHSQFGARLGLLAMWLLLVMPLLSHTTQVDQAGLPTWLSELSCSSEQDAQSHQVPLQHDLPWAKCGYCTLLLGSPALSSAAVASTTLLPLAGAPKRALASRTPQLASPFPAAHPRAPPLSLS
ncbi:DUF2946 family protein [Aquipseudomonas ullengensis]|uniref:DUF2946 domain-containing protein n=1 Tax=Aquipseudomonas ullengensis TaxID=2759166 RepID=A0A7W4LJB5_9GAMM|nr:DUF2946 family protein [Pseudomonas ullengensis]MBB2494230.1 DUF2946 domain-containing protein [Pseudomonas ullengensis]